MPGCYGFVSSIARWDESGHLSYVLLTEILALQFSIHPSDVVCKELRLSFGSYVCRPDGRRRMTKRKRRSLVPRSWSAWKVASRPTERSRCWRLRDDLCGPW